MTTHAEKKTAVFRKLADVLEPELVPVTGFDEFEADPVGYLVREAINDGAGKLDGLAGPLLAEANTVLELLSHISEAPPSHGCTLREVAEALYLVQRKVRVAHRLVEVEYAVALRSLEASQHHAVNRPAVA